MPRHELNPFALFFGAIFCGLGVAYLVNEWTWVDMSGDWLAAFLLVGLGAAGIASATARTRRQAALDEPNAHRTEA